MMLIPVKILIMIFTVVVKLGMVTIIFFGCCTGDVTYSTEPPYGCQWTIYENAKYLYGASTFVLGWFLMFTLELRAYIIGDAVGCWYWHGRGTGNVSRAVKNAFASHFGTLAFAGLVLWFVATEPHCANHLARTARLASIAPRTILISAYR